MSALLKAAEDACRWLEARCLGGEAGAIAKELREALEAAPALIAQQAARIEELEKDAARLDSGCIVTNERDEFGERYDCLRTEIDLRAAIDAAAIRQKSEGGAA